jgi:hypothetical protein
MADLVNEALIYDVSERIPSAREFRRRLARIRSGSMTVSSEDSQLLVKPLPSPQSPIGRSEAWEPDHSQASRPIDQTNYSVNAFAEDKGRCRNCGETIPWDARFCPYCSSDLRIAGRPSAKNPGRRSWLVIAIPAAAATGAIGFAAVRTYRDSSVQRALGLQSLQNLSWKRTAQLEAAHKHPLKLEVLSIALADATGAPSTPPSTTFRNADLQATKNLAWTAIFANQLQDLWSGSEIVEARLFDPSGTQISSSNSSRFVGVNDTTVLFSGIFSLQPVSLTAGSYRVGLFVGDNLVGEETLSVTQDIILSLPTLPLRHQVVAVSVPHRKQRRTPKTPYHIVIDRDFNQDEATAMTNRIRSLGYSVDMQKIDDDDRGEAYQLLVGAYASEDDAEAAQVKFRDLYDTKFGPGRIPKQ